MGLLFVLMTTGGINFGFRHAIPSYALLLMLCCRSMLIDSNWLQRAIVVPLAASAIDTARYFPALISYTNFPRDKVWMDVNDSNLDWGQALKQINNSHAATDSGAVSKPSTEKPGRCDVRA